MDLPRSNEQQTQFNDWITQFSIPCQKKKKKEMQDCIGYASQL